MPKLYLLLTTCLLLASCGASTETSQTTQNATNFEGSYSATALTQDATSLAIIENTRIDLTLEDDTISFSTGCNSAGGSYEIIDNKLATTGLSQTQIGCDQALTQQENFVTALISGAPTVDLQSDMLTLTNDSGEVTFTRQDGDALSLIDTKWVATSFLEGNTASTLPTTEPGHLTFIQDETGASLKGFDGCLLTEGAVTINNGKTGGPIVTSGDGEITFGIITSKPPAEDHVACAYDERKYAGTFTKLFDAQKVSYTIEADTLTLLDKDGSGIAFTAEK